MPVLRHRCIHPTMPPPPAPTNGNGHDGIRLQQARVLAVLMPDNPADNWIEWPLLTRAYLCLRAGFKLTSGSITRALNGIRPGNRTSGPPHLGLLERGLVEVVKLDICGLLEVNYRITTAGIHKYQAHIAAHGERLPEVKDAAICTNDRYALSQNGGAYAG